MKLSKLFFSALMVLAMAGPAIAEDVNSRNEKMELDYSIQGSGKFTVVFESGFGTDRQVWRPVLEKLPTTIRVISYSRKGLGKSSKPAKPLSVEQHLSDLDGLLEVTHANDNVILVGHSYGGLLATEYAKAQTDKLVGLVLVDPATLNQRVVFKKADPVRVEEDEAMLLGYMPSEMQADYRMLISQMDRTDNRLEPLRSDLPTILFTSTAAFKNPFVFEETKEGRALWLHLHSKLFSQVRNGSHVRVPNAGHNIHTEQPERIAKAIIEIIGLIENEN